MADTQTLSRASALLFYVKGCGNRVPARILCGYIPARTYHPDADMYRGFLVWRALLRYSIYCPRTHVLSNNIPRRCGFMEVFWSGLPSCNNVTRHLQLRQRNRGKEGKRFEHGEGTLCIILLPSSSSSIYEPNAISDVRAVHYISLVSSALFVSSVSPFSFSTLLFFFFTQNMQGT